MGTPGDKRTLEKVVAQKSSSSDSDKEPPLLSVDPSTESSEMGVLSRLPDFQLLAGPSEPTPHITSKPESFQASIEDYFSQTKYYTENLTTLYPVTTPPTFQSVDEPGPSGLQTLKTKTTTTEKGKKKKQERVGHKKSHPCPVCHRSFATGEKFNKHYQTHTGAPQFKCEHCKKTFSSKFKLVRHTLIHSDKKPFSCTVCERTFHRKDHLKNHIKVHSPTKKLYECEKADCNKQYTSQLSFRKHLAVHAAEEGNLTCQICLEIFEKKEDILHHLKVHAGSRTVKSPNEKKYVCDHCDRRFFTKKDVRRHLVVHTGMRDFLCQFCPQRFGRKDHLVRHIKKSHHKQYSEETVTQIKVESTARPETMTSELGGEVLFAEPTSYASLQDMPSTSMGPSPDIIVAKWPGQPVRVKIEQGDTMLDPDQFKTEDLGLEGVKTIFEEGSLAPLNEDELFLSSQSTQSELKEFYSEMFKQIAEPEQQDSPEVFDILETTESDDDNKPLPAFSKTFQPPPPP
ncbi:uncharacterized protein LOC143196456 isoform X2 [Rhynchophorus ferrugineus]|uniref:C2H2-type domain-containing protein n=1 Tax=Rhynchophorus ferrugineus TaxID=354439 RepID=A0A834MNI1_RHYFE|nr:hypothetical protein GWI33_010252 [Rhynchophorus ferrugineus]